MNRRDFGKLSGAAAIAAYFTNIAKGETTATPEEMTQDKKITIAMIAYPGMFLQDLVGPLTVFEALMNRDIRLVWKDKNPINAGSLIKITPTTTFSECPDDLDVLFLPGGAPGTIEMMKDKESLDFIAEKAKTAKFVTSVCTGSLILGAAGLLKGYKAASHWATLDVLKEFGAIPSDARIVEDRNRITGGGVTAGIDFGLALAAKLRNQTYAEAIQLYIEYNPQPPFNAGSPKTASKEVNSFVGGMLNPIADQARQIAKEFNKKQ